MRVSSNAPALSRRSIMRGMAAGLIGASVPVAAIAGITARKLTVGADGELLDRCQRWKQEGRKLKRMEKRLKLLTVHAQKAEPPMPPELFQPIKLDRVFVDDPYSPFHLRQEKHWTEDALEPIGQLGRFAPEDAEQLRSPQTTKHCLRLIELIKSHAKAKKRVWREHDCSERQWVRAYDRNWRLFLQIIGTKAETLPGAMAQLEVIDREDMLHPFRSDARANVRMAKLLRNVHRLVAAQIVEA